VIEAESWAAVSVWACFTSRPCHGFLESESAGSLNSNWTSTSLCIDRDPFLSFSISSSTISASLPAGSMLSYALVGAGLFLGACIRSRDACSVSPGHRVSFFCSANFEGSYGRSNMTSLRFVTWSHLMATKVSCACSHSSIGSPSRYWLSHGHPRRIVLVRGIVPN